MKHVASQLKTVRQAGRALLVVRRVAQVLAVLAPLAIVLGLLDYALRLPGPMRLVIGLAVAGAAGYWLLTRLNRALRFWPSLAELALRAERLYPQLAGSLASAVEFSMQPAGYAKPASTAVMAKTAVEEMEDKSHGVDLKRLIKLKPTVQACAIALLLLAVLGTVISAAPQASATAASRWFAPLGDAQWPKMNQVEALTSDRAVFPADGKVRLRAQVTRGWKEDMRMTIRYRVLDEAGEGDWTTVRVAEQRNPADPGSHVYETMIDVPVPVARSLMSGQRQSATLEVRYTAGDFTTDTQQLTLAARPQVASVVVTATPPTYTRGLLDEQRTPLHEQADRIASTSAYAGSKIKLDVRFNKPIPKAQAEAAASEWINVIAGDAKLTMPGNDDEQADRFTLSWTLNTTVTGSFVLTDRFSLTSTDTDKRYRVQAVEDEPPSVVLLRPAIDESVLPGATVQLQAIAEDDIAMQLLRLNIVAPDRENTAADAEQAAMRVLEDSGLLKTGRFESLDLDYELKLQPLALLPGDEVLITAMGRDVYTFAGEPRDEVASETRRLRVITEQELASQVRRVLRGVRNTAQSLERNQRIVADRTDDGQPAETAEQQGDIGRRIAAQRDTLDAVRERLDRNEPHGLDGLENLLDRAGELLDQAQEASDRAEESLNEAAQNQQAGEQARQGQQQAAEQGDSEQAQQMQQQAEEADAQQEQAEQQAGEAQEQTREQLGELIAALDMGESVGEIESDLASLRSDTERVARETRELLPRTIGQDADDLPEDLRERLEENAQDQAELAERAEELIDKMRDTAEEIGEQGETPEQRATAKTLSEAADIAQRQGLQENTEQAAQELEENQIADASSRQQQAQSTLEQMLAELGKQQQRRQEELKRLLRELAQKIQKLVDEQRDQLARAESAEADALGVLEQPQFALRRRTMLVEAEAMQAGDTSAVGPPLGDAVRDQAEAVKAIRVPDKQAVVAAEADALAHLEEALRLINEQQQEQQQEQQRQERLAVRQAYYDLADRQDALIGIVSQHERDQAYGRRDWRQINRLYEEPLEDKSFDEAQEGIRAAAAELGTQIGEAMVYQSLHRRIDQTANRAGSRLADRTIDAPVLDDQRAVARMLRSMGDALDDTADPDKFEKDDQGGEGQQPGGGQGEGEEPPLVPDLAQIKLLREVMIVLRQQTEAVDSAGEALTPEQRDARLADLAQQQRELKGLGEQLIEKLRQQMQPPPPPE